MHTGDVMHCNGKYAVECFEWFSYVSSRSGQSSVLKRVILQKNIYDIRRYISNHQLSILNTCKYTNSIIIKTSFLMEWIGIEIYSLKK